MGRFETFLRALIPDGSRKDGETESSNREHSGRPIIETDTTVSYLGVALEKGEITDSPYVPKREHYADFINDEFSLELQKKIAVSLLEGDPILIEGGTSIGKTTTIRKMAAELGWEVHYINLNGATDVEDLMGRYIPNPNRKKPEDPEYIFADGKVTSGLRTEEGKVKIIIVDEFNAGATNIIIRLHEVLDALERDGNVVLAEDASETVPVSKGKTKIVALMNPPGKGYHGREPLDPAQLRRWNYQKEKSELPQEAFKNRTRALFNRIGPDETMQVYPLDSRREALSLEELADIPGIDYIIDKYQEFHTAAKALVKERKIGADQPQPFTFDDSMEPRRVRNFIARYYNGDITETFQNALKYFYVNKLESADDRKELEELVALVEYVAPKESKRKSLDTQFDLIDGVRVRKVEYVAKDGTRFQPEDEFTQEGALFVYYGMDESDQPYLVKKGVVSPEPVRIEGDLKAQIEAAKRIMAEGGAGFFYGPDEIAEKYSGVVRLPEVIPPIPFSEDRMSRERKAGMVLRLQCDTAVDGTPLTAKKVNELVTASYEERGEKFLSSTDWYKEESFYMEDIVPLQWVFVAKEVLPNSTSKNYVEQTQVIAEYIQELWKGTVMPEQDAKDIAEWKKYHKREFAGKTSDDIGALLRDDDTWEKYSRELSELGINKNNRPKANELIENLAFMQDTADEKILPGKYGWTATCGSVGSLVSVGRFDADGAGVGRSRPNDSLDHLGVLLSRS